MDCRTIRAHLVARLLAAGLLASAPNLVGAQNEITPQPYDCELLAGELVMPVARVYEEPFTATVEGGYRLHVGEGFVRARKDGEVSSWWQVVAATEDTRLVGVQQGVAYFLTGGSTVERLDLVAHEWVEPLRPRSLADDPEIGDVQAALLGDDGTLTVLCAAGEELRVLCLARKSGELRWTQTLPGSEEREYTGGFLLAPRRPRYLHGAIRSLSRIPEYRDLLLVCTGELGALVALDAESGEERWRVRRLWEFQRGFIGPSVWSHHMSRLGAIGRKEFEARWECSLIGGPHVMPPAHRPSWGGTGILVATSRAPRGDWSGYLSDCLVYEVTGHGDVVSVTILPRAVQGWQAATVEGGVVWACANRAFVKMSPSESITDRNGGPGGPDARGHVEWYRELGRLRNDAWLASDPAGDPVVFTETYAFRVADGGFVIEEGEQVMQFPIWMVDLDDGAAEVLELFVPFEGSLSLPDTNYHRSGSHTRAHGWYGIALTWLEIEDETLYVTLGQEDWLRVVAFDLNPLFR